MKTDLRRDYFWNTLGVFLQNALSPLLLIFITRINGIYDSGLFSFAFAVAIIFWAIGMWGGRTYQASDVKKEFSYQSYIVARFVLAAIIIVGALVFAGVNQYDATKTSLIMALVIFKVVESISDALYGVLQTQQRLYIAGKSLTLKAILGLAVFVLIDLVTHNILLGCLGVIGVNILIVFLYDMPHVRKVADIHIGTGEITRYYREAVTIVVRCTPVFMVTFLAMFSLNIPRYFVDKYYPAENGYFGILVMPVTLLVLVISFILQPNIVRLAELFHQGKRAEFAKIVGRLSIFVGVIGVGVFVLTFFLGVPVLNLLFGLDFSHYKDSLMVLVVGAVLNALVAVMINILIIIRSIRPQFYVLLATNILLVIASISIVQQHALLGAMWLFAIISAVQVILLFLVYGMALRRSDHDKN